MLFTYLKRELSKRRKQTSVVAAGLAVAIGLVVTVSAASASVEKAQGTVLQSMYGIGTDISISKPGTPGFGGPDRFEIGSDDGNSADGSRNFSRTRFDIAGFAQALTAEDLATVAATPGVGGYTSTLKLNSITFNGELPDFIINQQNQGTQSQMPSGPGSQPNVSSTNQPAPAPSGGFDGRGGAAFDVTTFTVEGIDPSESAIGPMSTVEVSDGRLLTTADAGTYKAVLDSSYATTNKKSVGGTIKIDGVKFEIVGIALSTATGSSTSSNVYIPLDVAQKLSDHDGEVSNVYVQATSADAVTDLDKALTKALPDATVNSASELASSVSGTLTSASSLIQSLGKWLSTAVLIAAFLIAALLTASGVNRRTREFGTLKAIGWRSGRIVRQVMAESIVTSIIGGVLGIGVGLAGIAAVNHFAPTLTASVGGLAGMGDAGGPPGMPGGGQGPGRPVFGNTFDVALNATLSPLVLFTALALSLLGGLIAGMYGGWRASRLSPAESLRSVA